MIWFRVKRPMLLMVASMLTISSIVSRFEGAGLHSGGGQLPPDGNSQFFPPHAFGGKQDSLEKDYSRYLRSMGEKPLAELVDSEHPQVFRALVVLRPYNSPVVVRLSIRTDGSAELATKVGRDGGHPHILTVNRTSDVSRTDVAKFLQLLDDAGFWSIAALKPLDLQHVAMGAQNWMLEGKNEGTYHVVDRAVSELGTLKDSETFLVLSLANLDLRSLSVQPGE